MPSRLRRRHDAVLEPLEEDHRPREEIRVMGGERAR